MSLSRAGELPPPDRMSRAVGIGAVVVIHIGVGIALVDGLRRPPPIRAPAEPTLIQRLSLPPPVAPPPPVPTPQAAPPRIVKPAPTPRAPVIRRLTEAPAAPPPSQPLPLVAPAPVAAPAVASPAAAVAAPPPVAVPVAAPPAGPAAPARPAPANARTEIGVACPTQVQPEIPRRALQEGVGGVVRAQALIRGGAVVEVTILSGPRIYHAAVRAAMLQYRCVSEASEVVAVQEFAFRIE